MTTLLNNEALRKLSEEALNIAVAHIQNNLAQRITPPAECGKGRGWITDGGYAGLWFSGDEEEASWETFVDVLTQYATDEQNFINVPAECWDD